jgi:hypothetical protein
MSAIASLVALILAIALSMTARLNVGLAAIVFAWLSARSWRISAPTPSSAAFHPRCFSP